MIKRKLPPPPCGAACNSIFIRRYYSFTKALIVSSSVPCSVLVVRVTVLEMASLPEPLYTTLIAPLSPGAIASLGYSGTVQPQLLVALVITKGTLPVFLKLKEVCTSTFCLISPKSWVVSSNFIWGNCVACSANFSAASKLLCLILLAASVPLLLQAARSGYQGYHW